jgi:predicted transcriptional regulator
MPCSTLKLYIDIITTLTERGPLSVHELALFLKVKPVLLNGPIKFFADQAIIREKTRNSIVTYTATKRSSEILKFFKIQPLIKARIDEP